MRNIDDVTNQIKYLTKERKRFCTRLKNLQNYVAEHYPGYDEYAEFRIRKLTTDVEWYSKQLELLESMKLEIVDKRAG